MAKFTLNPGSPKGTQGYQPERVRIGSISVFALVVIICLAVLAVLSFSTANASLTMSQRQATATSELYLDERAAQEFLAGVDGILAATREGEMAKAVNAQTANDILMQLNSADSSAKAEDGTDDVHLARDADGNFVFDDQGYLVVEEKEDLLKSRAGEVGSLAVQNSLDELCAQARQAADGKVSVNATVNGNRIVAEFTCENGRLLTTAITVRNNGTYRIDRWKMSAVQNMEQPEGQLLIVD